MKFKALATAIILGICASFIVAQQQDPERAAYMKMRKDMSQAQTRKEKLEICRNFVKANPKGSQTSYAVQMGIYQFGSTDEFIDEALDFVGSVLPYVKNTENMIKVQRMQADLFGRAKRPTDLKNLAAEMEKSDSLGFMERMSLMRSGIACETWNLVIRNADIALKEATPEDVTKENPDSPYWTEANIQKSLALRHTFSLSAKGWALANLGKPKEGIAAFKAADEWKHTTYLGIPKGKLNIYWARALLKMGDHDGAIEKLAPGAVFKKDGESMKLMQQAYASKTGSSEGFDDFLWNLRLKIAKPIDDFTLLDYDGNEVTMSKLKGKVILLNFWYPT